MDKRVIESPRDCGRRINLGVINGEEAMGCEIELLGHGSWFPCPDPDRFPDDCPLERVPEDLATLLVNAGIPVKVEERHE